MRDANTKRFSDQRRDDVNSQWGAQDRRLAVPVIRGRPRRRNQVHQDGIANNPVIGGVKQPPLPAQQATYQGNAKTG